MSKPNCIFCGHEQNTDEQGQCRQCLDWQKHVCEFPAELPQLGPKSMLDDINDDLRELAESQGVKRIATLIADRWGLEVAEVAPYITAVALQVTLAHDEQLHSNPAEAFGRIKNMGYYVVRAAVAVEKIGWCQVGEEGIQLGPYQSASALAADTYEEVKDEESERAH